MKTFVLYFPVALVFLILLLGAFAVLQTALVPSSGLAQVASTTVNTTSTVVVGNASPVVSAVTLNNGSDITLTPNTTTNVSVNATVSDNNGCSDITGASASTSVLLYRSGVTSASCLASQNSLNCYLASTFTASSTCASGSTNTTTTIAVQYFAQATDASSSFSGNNWMATVVFKDVNNATGSADSAGGSTPDVLTLVAINVTTSTINYGTLSASSTSGVTNQVTTTTNVGNASITLKLSAQATLTFGSNSIPTSSQRYSTSSFTFAGTSTALSETATAVTSFLLTSPTSTGSVADEVFWGIEIPAGKPTGTYSGFNLFTSVFSP